MLCCLFKTVLPAMLLLLLLLSLLLLPLASGAGGAWHQAHRP
jgi:hypothetical protein